ncbi:hypothetical protein [Micromonospora sp. DT227]|uniref:hypothetical protein n=1 Tax=Micromonospora sp. DT227 TaxID=3393433 RepID=UPI003CF89873
MWPDDRDLPVEVEAAFGANLAADPGTWSWANLSDRLTSEPITLRAGKTSPTGQVSPGTCSVDLLNTDAALTPLHPLSPYWPNVDLGTPLRVRLRWAEDTFGRSASNGWGSADSGQAWTTGSGAVSNYAVTGGAGRHTHAATNVIRRTTLGVSLIDCEQVVDVAPSALLTGAALVTGLMFRFNGTDYYWLRAEMKSGGTAVMLKISRCAGSTFTDLAVLDPLPGVTYAANSYLRIRAQVVGTKLALKVWNPAGAEPPGWQLTAVDDNITTAGATGTQSWVVPGNTNTLPVYAYHRNYAARVDRFAGFADQWQPDYITSSSGGSDSIIRVTASGILRRRTQGVQPARSAMYRSTLTSSPAAYWPGEDGGDANQAASAVPGHLPMVADGVVKFAELAVGTSGGNAAIGSYPLPDLSGGGRLTASVPPAATALCTTSGQYAIGFTASVTQATHLGDLILLEWLTPGGSFVRWRYIFFNVGGTLNWNLKAYNAAGTETYINGGSGQRFGAWGVTVAQAGSNITVKMYFGRSLAATASVAGTVGGPTAIIGNSTGVTATEPVPMGHLTLWPTATPAAQQWVDNVDVYGTTLSGPDVLPWNREAAHLRLARLCAEDGIDFQTSTLSLPADSITRMGPQPTATWMNLVQECAEADQGLLTEYGFGVAYKPRAARYNPPVALTVDLATYRVTGAGGGVLKPSYDDETIRNRWTVARRGGSSATADDADSQRRGVYEDSLELNLLDDSDLLDRAGWQVHLTKDLDLQESTFPIDLAANPDLVDGWLSCRVGSRIVRTNPPAQHRPDPIDRLVEGWTETIGPRQWLVQVVPGRAEPWDVAVADGDQRAAADGSTLAASITATATTLQIASTSANGLWTTDPADFPLDIRVGGERVRLSAISGTTSPQSATVAAGGRAVNNVARSWPSGVEVDVWQPAIVSL